MEKAVSIQPGRVVAEIKADPRWLNAEC